MDILYFYKKGTLLNAVSKFCTYKGTIMENKLIDRHTVTFNKSFEILLKIGHLTKVPFLLQPSSAP